MAIWSRKPAEKASADAMSPEPPRSSVDAPEKSRRQVAPAAVTNGNVAPSNSPVAAPSKTPSQGDRSPIDPAVVDMQLGAAFASIVRVMLRSAQHRQMPIAELERRVLPAVRSRQFFIAQRRHVRTGASSPLGFVTWASVSDEISQQLETVAGEKNIALPVKAWRSGGNIWMLDAVGQTAVLNKMLETLADTEWKGQRVRARVKTADGNVVIRTVQAVKRD